MQKFDEWNEVKKKTHNTKRKLGLKPREIFWAKVGQNIGSEEYGKDANFVRPVLIVRKLTSDLFIGVPLTTTSKHNDYFHYFKYEHKTKGEISTSAMILQVKAFSIKRLLNKIGLVNRDDFEVIVKKLQNVVTPPTKS
jgi:mRNA interferase MazF